MASREIDGIIDGILLPCHHTRESETKHMRLNDARIRTLKPGERPTKHGDSGGLLLVVNPNGSKLWRMVFRYCGKQKQLSFGAWPNVSLAQARAHRDAARKLLADNIDPSLKKKQDKIAKAEAETNWTCRGFIPLL